MDFMIVGGSGIQGQAIIKYLYEKTDEDIIVMDPRPLPDSITELYGDRLSHSKFEFSPKNVPRVKDVIVISCLPTEHNLDLMTYCINETEKGYKNYFIDLGGSTETALKQLELHDKASEVGAVNVLEAGIAPGIISPMAKDIANEEGVIGIRIYCGGFPKYPEAPHYHSKTFYTNGMIKEYFGIARELVNGEITNYPALSGEEKIFVPGLGVVEARRTSGGLSLLPYRLDISHLSYKTLRFPGHWEFVEKYILNQQDSTYVLDSVLPKVNIDNPDILVLCFHIDYEDGDEVIERYYFEYDYEYDVPAMAQATGYVVGAVATMINDGLVSAGVNTMDQLDVNELCERSQLDRGCFSSRPIIYEPDEEE
jgi:saccharopine dehydrogenase-like NADP-dependent oxidoreductase